MTPKALSRENIEKELREEILKLYNTVWRLDVMFGIKLDVVDAKKEEGRWLGLGLSELIQNNVEMQRKIKDLLTKENK